LRDTNTVMTSALGHGETNGAGANTTEIRVPSSSIKHIDAVAAGTYVYKIQIAVANGSGEQTIMRNAKLVAYEL